MPSPSKGLLRCMSIPNSHSTVESQLQLPLDTSLTPQDQQLCIWFICPGQLLLLPGHFCKYSVFQLSWVKETRVWLHPGFVNFFIVVQTTSSFLSLEPAPYLIESRYSINICQLNIYTHIYPHIHT
jgi:hypothetical protein